MVTYLIFFLCLLVSAYCDFPWVKPEDLNVGLPKSIEIYTLNTTDSQFSSKLTGAFIKFDFRDSNLEFKVSHTEDEKSRTPMQWADECNDL
jgi:hypothetical protein